MTAEEHKVVKMIISAGSAGVKRTDLRRELGADIDTVLEKAVNRGEVFVDKKASAYYCFHRDHYVQSLLNSDPRFRLTYDMLKSIEESVSTIAKNVSHLARVMLEMKNEQQSSLYQQQLANSAASAAPRRTMNVYDFKNEFDVALANSTSSVGWVELAKLRNELCDKCGLSSDEFYRLVEELMNQNQDKYELSSGGSEGVMVRGLLHGFVRCI
jgi:hypothetical protein